jgi:hypothetical protein
MFLDFSDAFSKALTPIRYSLKLPFLSQLQTVNCIQQSYFNTLFTALPTGCLAVKWKPNKLAIVCAN